MFLPGESHGQRTLVGYSPWGRKESDTTECSLACTPKLLRGFFFFFFLLVFTNWHSMPALELCDPGGMGQGQGHPPALHLNTDKNRAVVQTTPVLANMVAATLSGSAPAWT